MNASHEGPRGSGVPPIFRKVLIALIGGGIAYLITQLAPDSGGDGGRALWELTIAIFIAGVTLVVQFIAGLDDRVIGLESRQAEHHRGVKGLIDQKFSEINEATELFGLVEGSALQTEQTIQLIRHSTKIKETTSSLVRHLAEAEINRMSLFLKELSDGSTVSYDGEDRDWLLALALNTRRTLDATSLSMVDAGNSGFDGGFWLTDMGQRYLDLQQEITRRGGVVRRVFIESGDLIDDPSFLEVCQVQKEAGIGVRLIDPDKSANIPHSALFGFIVFDGEISYEVTPAARFRNNEQPTIVSTQLVLQPARVRERIRHFEALWEAATEV